MQVHVLLMSVNEKLLHPTLNDSKLLKRTNWNSSWAEKKKSKKEKQFNHPFFIFVTFCKLNNVELVKNPYIYTNWGAISIREFKTIFISLHVDTFYCSSLPHHNSRVRIHALILHMFIYVTIWKLIHMILLFIVLGLPPSIHSEG